MTQTHLMPYTGQVIRPFIGWLSVGLCVCVCVCVSKKEPARHVCEHDKIMSLVCSLPNTLHWSRLATCRRQHGERIEGQSLLK